MLFFFELFLFVLVMLTLALGEFVSRGLALTLWLVVTAFTLAGYLFARRSLHAVLQGGSAIPFGDPGPVVPQPGAGHGHPESLPTEPTVLDEKWARTLLYNWRRTNALLVLGAVVAGGWYWLGTRG
ncbi:MAG: hypothetical protein IT306_11095 [Chloroflexi bacterium]|nr:hypothetical protein [Chloroflexota bacterium]